MKKIFLIILVLINVFGSLGALSFDIDVIILNEAGIKENRPYHTINLGNYSFWNPTVRAVYLEIKIKSIAAWSGQTFTLYIRPVNDETDIRRFSFNATESYNGDAFVQYLWLPVNHNGKAEYKLLCPEGWSGAIVDLNLAVRGLYTDPSAVISDDLNK